jgi:hypothetical protein
MTEGMRDEEMRALYKKSTEESQIRQKKVLDFINRMKKYLDVLKKNENGLGLDLNKIKLIDD